MQAMILTAPPHSQQVSMSILNTRLRRCAQVMEARRSTGVGSSGSPVEGRRPPLPRKAFVTRPQYRLLGANAPWKRHKVKKRISLARLTEFLRY